MTKCILASTSTIHNSTYLEYLFDAINELYKDTKEVLFIPYARPSGISYEEYTSIAKKGFNKIGKKLIGIQDFKDPIEAIQKATGIFTGGGNTFVLVSTLYRKNLIQPLQDSILNGTPYLGTSAGSNIAGVSMKTTNDMPVVYTPSFKTLGIVPFNINAHYLDPDPNSTHKGETRETRIKEFHQFNKTPVVGLREGSWIRVQNDICILEGKSLTARIFEKDKVPYEVEPKTSLHYLK
ncbi:dipeptidase PepE [uncultured Maribacter sp.]|uniref:dipeptidase PepE n=1 Tax=uncultured Maribacter sp. TaxID=431308 RepID=UPI002608620B|nr:dipeptidase PepE [uncultured Maribacter sp.]